VIRGSARTERCAVPAEADRCILRRNGSAAYFANKIRQERGGFLMSLRSIALGATMGTFALLALGGAASAQDATGPVIAGTCVTCHGVDGKGQDAVPAINGKPAATMSAALKDFKTDKRMGTMMNRLAKGFSDAEIDAVAAYFANVK
jgi:sulfide dehydrogenase cytochrome subunit